jgi:hypothetical protein
MLKPQKSDLPEPTIDVIKQFETIIKKWKVDDRSLSSHLRASGFFLYKYRFSYLLDTSQALKKKRFEIAEQLEKDAQLERKELEYDDIKYANAQELMRIGGILESEPYVIGNKSIITVLDIQTKKPFVKKVSTNENYKHVPHPMSYSLYLDIAYQLQMKNTIDELVVVMETITMLNQMEQVHSILMDLKKGIVDAGCMKIIRKYSRYGENVKLVTTLEEIRKHEPNCDVTVSDVIKIRSYLDYSFPMSVYEMYVRGDYNLSYKDIRLIPTYSVVKNYLNMMLNPIQSDSLSQLMRKSEFELKTVSLKKIQEIIPINFAWRMNFQVYHKDEDFNVQGRKVSDYVSFHNNYVIPVHNTEFIQGGLNIDINSLRGGGTTSMEEGYIWMEKYPMIYTVNRMRLIILIDFVGVVYLESRIKGETRQYDCSCKGPSVILYTITASEDYNDASEFTMSYRNLVDFFSVGFKDGVKVPIRIMVEQRVMTEFRTDTSHLKFIRNFSKQGMGYWANEAFKHYDYISEMSPIFPTILGENASNFKRYYDANKGLF